MTVRSVFIRSPAIDRQPPTFHFNLLPQIAYFHHVFSFSLSLFLSVSLSLCLPRTTSLHLIPMLFSFSGSKMKRLLDSVDSLKRVTRAERVIAFAFRFRGILTFPCIRLLTLLAGAQYAQIGGGRGRSSRRRRRRYLLLVQSLLTAPSCPLPNWCSRCPADDRSIEQLNVPDLFSH